MDGQSEQTNAKLCYRFMLNLGCTERMVSENIKLGDVCSVSSSVKFGDNGILQAAHVEKLITDEVVLTGVLMLPGLTRNLVSKDGLMIRVALYIRNKVPKQCTTT